jgi:hypothetical protein
VSDRHLARTGVSPGVIARTEASVVNAAGLVQGIALVTFPAASGIFTSGSGYGLSSSQYGAMFGPQVVTAIGASLLGSGLLWPGFARRVSLKRIYLAGLLADLAAMALLIVSWAIAGQQAAAYATLLVATGCLGAGFGLAVPSLNTFAAAFHAGAEDRSVLVLNALLGLGTALAPAFVAAFNGAGFWVGLPAVVACLLAIVIAVGLFLPLDPRSRGSDEANSAGGISTVSEATGMDGAGRVGGADGMRSPVAARPGPGPGSGREARLPAAFWLFGGFACLYGICETLGGNWSQLDLTSLGIRPATASLALTGFWGVVTAGRVLVAAIARWLPSRVAYHGLPFLLAVAFALISALPKQAPGLSVAAFCLAGLGCSALLPLTISFGQEKLAGRQAAVAGGVIACYQVGYGVAAFGVGPLVSAGTRISVIFGAGAVVAAIMGAFSLVVARGRPSPASLHPRPARSRFL